MEATDSMHHLMWYLMGAESPFEEIDERWISYLSSYGGGQGALMWRDGYGDQYSYSHSSGRALFTGHGDISNIYGSGRGDGSN